MEKSIWLAASSTGQMQAFVDKPTRNEHRGVWMGTCKGCVSSLLILLESEGLRLPLMKWNDEPREIKIKVEL